MTKSADLVEASADHHGRRQTDFPAHIPAVSRIRPSLMRPEGMDQILTRADQAFRSSVVGRVQVSVGNRAVQRLVEEPPPFEPATSGVSLSHSSDRCEQVAEANAYRTTAGKTAPPPSEMTLGPRRGAGAAGATGHPTVQRLFDGVGDWLAETASGVGGAAMSLGGSVVDAYSGAASGIGGALRSGAIGMTKGGMGVGRALLGGYGALLGAGGGIADAVLSGGGLEGVLGAVGSGASQLGEAGSGLWDAAGGYAGATTDALSGVGRSVATGAAGVGQAAWQGAGDLWAAWSGAAGGLGQTLGEDIDPSLLLNRARL